MKKVSVFLFLFFVATIGFAKQPPLSCEERTNNSKVKKEQRESFCRCWSQALADLTDEEIKILRPWVQRKIKNADLEKRDPALAEHIYKIEEDCLDKIQETKSKKRKQ